MKDTLFTIYKVLLGLVLLGHISDWFFDYSDETNQLLNTAMFSLVGVAYIVMGYFWDNTLVKVIFMACGAYLLAMPFLQENTFLTILGIICMLTPILIGRFFKTSKKLAEEK